MVPDVAFPEKSPDQYLNVLRVSLVEADAKSAENAAVVSVSYHPRPIVVWFGGLIVNSYCFDHWAVTTIELFIITVADGLLLVIFPVHELNILLVPFP